MSLIKAIKHRLGLSVTPANNFVWDASADNGTMKLARESGQDIMTVDAAGRVNFPFGMPQASGAQIVESGLSGSGETEKTWVKFADGTMFQSAYFIGYTANTTKSIAWAHVFTRVFGSGHSVVPFAVWDFANGGYSEVNMYQFTSSQSLANGVRCWAWGTWK